MHSLDTPAEFFVEVRGTKVDLPHGAIGNLVRPDWDEIHISYSLSDYDIKLNQWVERPYFLISIPMRGPVDKSWDSTWVTYRFDADGHFGNRVIKRLIDLPETKSIRELWKDWPIGKGTSADDLLEDHPPQNPPR